MSVLAELLLTLRLAKGYAQQRVAQDLGLTQATWSRYESGLRVPDLSMRERIATYFGVSARFLETDFRRLGAVAVDAHMRRKHSARPAHWQQVEAQLNIYRLQCAYVNERVPMSPATSLPQMSSDEGSPASIAQYVRSMWGMPIGTVRDLSAWIESSGVFIFEEEFPSSRLDGMSQWASGVGVIIVNSTLPTDRKRFTLAHELGHLVMHSNRFGDEDLEREANEFAAEFLMPKASIAPQLRSLTLGRAADLKAQWGVSMQAIYEHAYRLGMITHTERATFYKQVAHRGWKKREPGSEYLTHESPKLASSIGKQLLNVGLSENEVRDIIGLAPDTPSPFMPSLSPQRLTLIK